MNKFMEGLKGLAMGMEIAVMVPTVIIKTAVGNVIRKKTTCEKVEVKETKVNINEMESDAQEWAKRLYNKKNGIA